MILQAGQVTSECFIVLWLQQLSQFAVHLGDKQYVNDFSVPGINYIYDRKNSKQN